MAGIEKVCEYSGDYPGGDMYAWKHNHIQICPKYRKLFRGQEATLYIEYGPKLCFKYRGRWGGSSSWFPEDAEHFEQCQGRVVKEYWYTLYVPGLPGEVEGKYLNWSTDLSTVKRKMKRLLRCKKLNIKWVEELP